MGTQFRCKVFCAVLCLLMIGSLSSLKAEPTGSISGVVRDSSGAAMPGVTVQVMNWESGMARRTVTNGEGRYSLDNVAPGSLDLSFTGEGFESANKSVQLTTESAVFNITLGLTASAQAGQQGNQQMPNMPNMPQGAAQPAQQPEQELTDEQLTDLKVLIPYVRGLQQRVTELESYAVMSIPETRVKRIEVYVDENSNEYTEPRPGTKRVVTYQRERVFRRQTIDEKIEAALAGESEKSVAVGVSAAIMPQGTIQTSGAESPASRQAYYLASADISFAARVAQNTTFYADLVGLTGPTPDQDIQGLTLLNAYTARLNTQNRIDLREAWLHTEFFSQALSVRAGRVDLTAFIDRNAGGNDETRQFLSDALVNNPVLGLASNGVGFGVVFDPKRTYTFKFGLQQNDPEGTSLSKSLIALGEFGYYIRPPFLQGGTYRVWARSDNTGGGRKNAVGLSFDQGLTDNVLLFGRFGYGYVMNAVQDGNMLHYSGGVQFQNQLSIYPGDTWGIGYAQTNLTKGAARENLGEVYYNFQLTERLRLSPRIQFVREYRTGNGFVSHILPGVRFQAEF